MRRVLSRLTGSRRAQVVALVVVAAFVAGFTFLGLWLAGGGSEPAQSQAEPPPLTADDFWPDKQGVLHFCAVPGEEPDWPAGWCASEIWFDPRNQRGRAERHDQDGTLQSLAVVDGDTYAEYDPDLSTVEINRILEGGRTLRQWVLRQGHNLIYEAWLTQDQSLATETEVDGVPVLRIETTVLGEKGTKEAVEIAYLDKASHLPIRIDWEPTGGGGQSGQIRTRTYWYRPLEWLPSQAVDPSLFTLPKDLPEVEVTQMNKEMTVEEARAFRDFDVYWLGESFRGLSLSRVLEFRSTPGNGSLAPWTHRLAFNYSTPDTADEVTVDVSNVPVAMFNQPLAEPSSGPGPSDRQVAVAGTRGVLSSSDDHAMLSVRLGDTFVNIHGNTEDQALAAGDALAKLN